MSDPSYLYPDILFKTNVSCLYLYQNIQNRSKLRGVVPFFHQKNNNGNENRRI